MMSLGHVLQNSSTYYTRQQRHSPLHLTDPLFTANMQSLLKPFIGPKKEIHDLTGRVALVAGGALGIG